ncbi:MAG: hypothetical protein ACM3U1_12705 [Chloroflexota bacterium]
MSKALSAFFSNDRAYITVVNRNEKGMELLYVNSTESLIDLEDINGEESLTGRAELNQIFEEIGEVDEANVALPAESVIVSQFPYRSTIKEIEIRYLVELEIKNVYPLFNFDDFSVELIPFGLSEWMMAVLIPNFLLKTVKELLAPVEIPIKHIDISQINAHSAFLFNYPEDRGKLIAIFNVQDRFIDISVVNGEQPEYYNLLSYNSPEEISEKVAHEFDRIAKKMKKQPVASYFFGSAITRTSMLNCWEAAMERGIEAKRLNAFRMMSSKLGARERAYCARVFHLFPPCVGAAIPTYHHRKKIIK